MPDVCTPLTRERLAIIAIEAEQCPLVLARILAFFAPRGVIAFTIRVRRIGPVQAIELEVDGTPETVRSIVHHMRRLPMVRRAHAATYAEHYQGRLPLRAKL